MPQIYPKLYKHPNGYLVWARYVASERDPWRKNLLTEDDENGWYVTVSRDGELFVVDDVHDRLIDGPYPTLQDAMVAGVAVADDLPVLESLS